MHYENPNHHLPAQYSITKAIVGIVVPIAMLVTAVIMKMYISGDRLCPQRYATVDFVGLFLCQCVFMSVCIIYMFV